VSPIRNYMNLTHREIIVDAFGVFLADRIRQLQSRQPGLMEIRVRRQFIDGAKWELVWTERVEEG
jgi:hypothetical protein